MLQRCCAAGCLIAVLLGGYGVSAREPVVPPVAPAPSEPEKTIPLQNPTPVSPDRGQYRIRVTVRYPGASVQVIDSTVALPLLKELDGVEGAARVEAESTRDGTCTITLWLDPKAEPAKMEALIRKRVARTEPLLPKACDRKEIVVRTDPAQPAEFWFALTNTNDGDDTKLPADLANHARATYPGALRRVPGVTEVRALPATKFALRIWLNPDKLRSLQVSSEDIGAALQTAVPTSTARLGQATGLSSQSREYVLDVQVSGQLPNFARTLGEIVVKENGKGEKILLGDVAKVEVGSTSVDAYTTFDGKPAALLAVTADRNTALEPIERVIAALRKEDPPGVHLTAVVTPATPRVLCLEMQLPAGSTPEYTHAKCGEVDKIVRAWNGELPTITYTGSGRQSHTATLLVPCKPDADVAALRKRFTGAGELAHAAIRICDVTGGKPAFPVRLALVGPDAEQLRKWSEAIVTRARKDGLVSDAADWPGRDATGYELVFNNDAATKKGVSIGKALDNLNILIGSTWEQGFIRYNQFYKVYVQGPEFRRVPEDLDNLFIKNDKGELVPYSAFATIQRTTESASIYRFGPDRALRITANPAGGKSVADCTAKLRALAEDEKTSLKLPAGYRVVVLAP